MKKVLLLAILFLSLLQVWAQTPGLIIKPAVAPGNNVLDPDGDGYVSQKTNGVQIGFTIPPDNDVTQSEIPYVAIVRPDPTADILRGPVGGFIEIVGVDAAGNNAILTYNDGTNLLYRFRMGGYAPNSKSYSILIDSDGKFGFTGVNADLDAVSGNPGFEAEIVLETNFNIKAYNVNGTTSGTQIASYLYETNCQKSMAVSEASGDPDYFYDFFLPFSSFSTLFNASTPLRIVAVTTMNPHPATGNNALSDVGGVTSGSNIDLIFEELIEDQTPTVPGEEVLDIADCPTIDAVATTSTTLSGTTTEAVGTTININVYATNGTIERSGSLITTGPSWSISIASLTGVGSTLAAGKLVKATATALGKGVSNNDCDIETVTDCAGVSSISGITLTRLNGGKGYSIANTFPANTIFTWYNADFTLAHYPVKSGSSTYITNPQVSTTASQTIYFETETGQTFPDGVFYFTFQEPTKCVSAYLADCQYSISGTSLAPTITTTSITTATTSVTGTCGSSANTLVSLFADGIFLKSTSVVSSTNWTIIGLDLSNYDCATITASATDAGQCPTTTATGVQVKHIALKPLITSTGCAVSPPDSLTGFCSEADGTTITLFDTNPTRTQIGTATVTRGEWTAKSLITAFGDVIVAKVTSGNCLSAGPDSDPITISTQTDNSDFSAVVNTVTEGDITVGGTITGALPVDLNLYADGSLIGSTTIGGSGIGTNVPWSIGSLTSKEIYIGGILKITFTSTGNCESDPTTYSTIVQCKEPLVPTYTSGSYSYCVGGAGEISLLTSEEGVIYQLVDGLGSEVGPTSIGNGGAIQLKTYAITTNVLDVYVNAYKIGYPSCFKTSSAPNDIDFNIPLPTPSINFTTTSLYVIEGTTSVNLPFESKSSSPSADKYTIDYTISANQNNFIDVIAETALPAAPGTISITVPANPINNTYPGTLTVHSDDGGVVCTRSYSFTVTVVSASSPPVITSQPTNKTICEGNSTVLSATVLNATGFQWQSASTLAGTYTNILGATSSNYTASPATTTYYKLRATNASGTSTSNVATVTVNTKPVAGDISGDTPVCAGQSATYSLTAIPGATSYTWSYSGLNATVTPSSNSATIDFAPDATTGDISVYATNLCGNGASKIKTITILETPLIGNMSATACSGEAFGVTPVSPDNGIVPTGTTYSWGEPTLSIGLSGGELGSGTSITGTLINATTEPLFATYTITPTANGCAGNSFTLSVSVSPAIVIAPSISNVLCYGASTGSINIAASGGTPSYSYDWGGGITTQNRSDLIAATYNITVTDSKGCTSSATPEVTQPTELTITPNTTFVSCNGGNDGEINIDILGGTGTKTYLWNNGSANKDLTNLIAGTYSLTVTDGNGCVKTSGNIDVDEPIVLSVPGTITHVKCFGESNGEIHASATGGNSPYTYDWVDIIGTDDGSDRTGLAIGTYNVTVTDAKGCTKTESFTVNQPILLTLGTVVVRPTCPATEPTTPPVIPVNSDGSINLNINGGNTPYTCDWSDIIGTDDGEDRTAIPAGTYSVVVTDDKGCIVSTSVTLTELNPNPVTPGTISK